MLSIVICSRNKIIDRSLDENIRLTIGCEYEMIAIDNSENSYSIYEAYNLGIDRSRGDLICFMHDDILLHTQGWGRIVNDVFAEKPKIGLLGIAGSRIKSSAPSGWWDCTKKLRCMHVLQHNNGEIIDYNLGFDESDLVEVSVLDGVFMVLRRNAGVRLNTQIKGFHCYDTCLSVECRKRGARVYVTNRILIEHFSHGTLNQAWYDAAIITHDLYRADLPLTVPGYEEPALLETLEYDNIAKFIAGLHKLNCQPKIMYKMWFKMLLARPFRRRTWSVFKLLMGSMYKHRKDTLNRFS